MVGLFASLVVANSVLRENMTRGALKLLIRADVSFGLSAAATVATGLLQLYLFGKGAEYYLANPLFIAKFLLFIVVGGLSVFPTITFLKLRKRKDERITVPRIKTIRWLLRAELVILLLLPLLGVWVASGVSSLIN